MSSKSFENYARISEIQTVSHTEVAGRYDFQASAQRRIIIDVMTKLELSADDVLLEVGCGPGNLLLPLSHMTARAVGIDNAGSLQRLAARAGEPACVEALAGDFMTMELPSTRFSKILIYSVIQYMSSEASALAFVRRAFDLLKPGGRLLVGDLPNRDKKRRFSSSSAGAIATAEWQKLLSTTARHPMAALPEDDCMVQVDDAFVLSLMRFTRESGFESYLLSQPADLPFGNSREDLLVVAPR